MRVREIELELLQTYRILMLDCCFSENGIELKVKAINRLTSDCWIAQDRESSTIIAINFQESWEYEFQKYNNANQNKMNSSC